MKANFMISGYFLAPPIILYAFKLLFTEGIALP